MKTSRRNQLEGGACTALGRCRIGLAVMLGGLALVVGGCGGGSGGGAAAVSEPPVTPPVPPTGTTVVVTVVDPFGVPVANASVRVFHFAAGADRSGTTDASGRAQIAASVSGLMGVGATAIDSAGYSDVADTTSATRWDYTVIAHPTAAPTGGYTNVDVPNAGVSSDGRTLEFSISLIGVPQRDVYLDSDWFYDPAVDSCVPDTGNDQPQFRADCVAGPGDSDASYQATVLHAGSIVPIRGSGAAPALAVALLLDQGSASIVNDPSDRRLLAARYFMTQVGIGDQVILGAFASDDLMASQLALIPLSPVTVFPIEDPQFTSQGRGYFPLIDSLAMLEGGASPLYSAIDRMIDFTSANAPADTRPVVVAVSSGEDATCGGKDACLGTQEAVAAKSVAGGVDVYAIELLNASGRPDREASRAFAQGGHGGTIWARDPRQLATTLGAMPALLTGRMRLMDVTVRLESPVAGAFASGRTVLGTAHMDYCPWDCAGRIDIPFAVRVP